MGSVQMRRPDRRGQDVTTTATHRTREKNRIDFSYRSRWNSNKNALGELKQRIDERRDGRDERQEPQHTREQKQHQDERRE